MWPFTSSPSSAPILAEGPVSIHHPSLGRPLTNSEAADPKLNPRNPEGLKPCCACPETKKARDDCFLLHGSNADSSSDSQDKCREIVAQHRACMRKLGFNV
ncbi:cytochromec oxidase copper chaperone [Rhodotorula toruloides]|uniref:Cytochromec oxidase copper chaperone n=1 Tax=Rhodotorula toruloides TaxID=5286 RepID=A0A511KG97_RHOTO|nr:cytochromec oxidase copper chaperone [Rhodotorula toruloides]